MAYGAFFRDGGAQEDGPRHDLGLADWTSVLESPDVAVYVDRGGRSSLHRPDVLLVGLDDVVDRRFLESRRDLGVTDAAIEECRGRAEAADLPVAEIPLPPRSNVVAVSEFLRGLGGHRPLVVGPDHLLWPTQGHVLGPAMPPTPGERTARRSSVDGEAVAVAVLDSGLIVEALEANALLGVSTPTVPGPGDLDPMWDPATSTMLHWVGGHGTHVAGTLAAAATAAGGAVRITHRCVVDFDPSRPGTFPLVSDSSVARAMVDVIGKGGVRVVNLSLGGPTALDLGTIAITRVLARARARKQDHVVVASAGNESTSRPMFPAADKGVIAVGALTEPSPAPAVRANFSNHGPWVDCATAGVDLVGPFATGTGAPGLDGHVDPFEGWAAWSGTSFCAPQVAGRIAASLAAAGGSARVAAATVLAAGDPLDPALGLGVRID